VSQIIADIDVGHQLSMSIHKQYKCNLPSFSMLVNQERKTKVLGLDMHNILQKLSRGSTYIFWEFIKTRNAKTNIVKYLPKTTAERKALTKAYKELHDLEIIKRVRQGEYLINPLAHIPTSETFDDVKKMWDGI